MIEKKKEAFENGQLLKANFDSLSDKQNQKVKTINPLKQTIRERRECIYVCTCIYIFIGVCIYVYLYTDYFQNILLDTI